MTRSYENQGMYYEKSHRAKKSALPRIISDHLGSIRVVLKEDGNVESWSDYYPFGKESRSGYSQNTPKEKYTGKERDIEIGLDYFGARYYNADIGRWTTKDPLAEKYPSLSPYHYSNNNPILFVDFDGRDFGIKVDHDAKTIVISANYYISQSQGDAQQMTAGAVAQWNSYTGSYTTRDGIEYSVSIELKACVASDLGAKGDANLDAIGNSVTGLSSDEFDTKNPPKDGKSIVGGVTKDNRMIDLSIGRANENATAHEIGHTLLLADKYGFGNNSAMQQSGKNPVSQGDVKKLIEYGIDGVRKSNRHIQVSQSGNYTGKKGFASRGLKEIFFGRKINVDKKDNE